MKIIRFIEHRIHEFEDEIYDALNLDLGKKPFEVYETEIMPVLQEIKYLKKNIRKLKKPKRARTPIMHFYSKSWTIASPYGQVLVMAPWNYPFQLSMVPLISALAAGNTVVLKPSEMAEYTSKLLKKFFDHPEFDELVRVEEGGIETSNRLLDEKHDKIFFTGSTSVGKIVMEKASKHLTPVSLELGGKSPCIVDESADLKLAARRIVWGKGVNAGQTCVAPDYVFVHESVKDEFVGYVNEEIVIQWSYGDMARIVNQKHFDRLNGYLNRTPSSNDLYMNLEIAVDPSWETDIMREEIFGPILPIISYRTLDEVIERIHNPLALYLFTKNKETENLILNSCFFGGACVNDVLIHFANQYLPFGGIGDSGMGSYHGKAGFDCFTHTKSVMKKSFLFDIQVRYAPYRDKIKILKRFAK